MLETEDVAAFELFQVQALVFGQAFTVESNGTAAYFDFVGDQLDYAPRDIEGTSGGNSKIEGVPVQLILTDEKMVVQTSQALTSYHNPAADLIGLSQYLLSSRSGQDLLVEAKYFIQGLAVELVLIRARLEDGNLASMGVLPGAGRTYVALRPLSVLNDTHALFRVPPGLKSGVYAASLKSGSVVSQ